MSLLSSAKPFFQLLLRYGLVGVLASIVHAAISLVLHEWLLITPFPAHAAGVVGGTVTAYVGHYHYSFKDDGKHQNRFPKFVIAALIGLALHQGGVWFLVEQLNWDYSTLALPVLMLSVPAVTFLLSKFWVFR